jgi:uridylate kinase
MSLKYKRILLKLSGESLAGAAGQGIDTARLEQYCEEIKALSAAGLQIAIVIGGGNIFRGLSGSSRGFDRVTGDQMGMLATIINSLALRSGLENIGVAARVFTAINMAPVGQQYNNREVIASLGRGEVAILGGGTGNPFFTTDTGASLRAIEIKADAMLKGTRVDGIYNVDPEKDPNAIKFDKITYDDVIRLGLKVMDITATAMCMENKMPVVVFDMDTPGNLQRVINGDPIGTVVY